MASLVLIGNTITVNKCLVHIFSQAPIIVTFDHNYLLEYIYIYAHDDYVIKLNKYY